LVPILLDAVEVEPGAEVLDVDEQRGVVRPLRLAVGREEGMRRGLRPRQARRVAGRLVCRLRTHRSGGGDHLLWPYRCWIRWEESTAIYASSHTLAPQRQEG
jgi:hypothetical protein